jgi:capsular polysaccharide biosynthesis protein
MELKIFLRLLLKRWWIVLSSVLVTVAGTLIFTYFQTRVYSASVTYVVSPSSEVLNGTNFLSGLSVLGGQPTVANTYASIASSETVKQKATQILGLSLAQAMKLKVSSRVQTNTNIIEITVEGSDPLLVQGFATKIGESTVEYVNTLSGVYDLKILDGAKSPGEPIRPNMKLNVVLGLALGLILGCGLAFLLGISAY